jgi:subtilisin family serine protease
MDLEPPIAPDFSTLEPSAVAAGSITPEDEPEFPLQWHLQAMEVPAAWEEGYTGHGVRVAVLDGGIDSSHPDLVDNLDLGASVSFVPGFDFDQDTGFLTGGILFWHGTLVAGVVAAADNGLGTLGVAPEATLIGVKVADGLSVSFSALLQGIYYAATTAEADILNLSLGRARVKQGADIAAQKTAIYRAITFAERQGALVVASAGNSALDLDHSQNLAELVLEAPGVVGVSATGPVGFFFGATNFRRPATYSSYGHSVIDVAAPGGNFTASVGIPAAFFDLIRTTNTTHADPPSPGVIQPWFWQLGTSFAAPNVSGVAALIKQRFPNHSPARLRHQLLITADNEGKPGHDAFYGRGFVNARRAVIE